MSDDARNKRQRLLKYCAPKHPLLQILLAETVGTFILVALGTGAIAQAVLIRPSRINAINMATIALGWGIGLCIGICAARRLSGGHLNPAVTLAQACRLQTPWSQVPAYLLAQYVGGYLAARLCLRGLLQSH